MSEARTIHIPVTMGIAKRKADGSVKLEFVTLREIDTEQYVVMDSFRQSQGHLLFRENSFKEEEVPAEDVETDVAKSQSVQLRDALWVLYKARGYDTSNKKTWNDFYRNNMQAFKAKLLNEVHILEGRE